MSETNGKLGDRTITLDGMYQDYFMDYASYVILERAVPSVQDGLKPVQRRILHAMKDMDDGRFHKVANIIGQTMQYHPHGDAAIGDALVNLGQKDLLIDCQGNWGDVRTGDSAAAARYIEARLTKFALEVAFNPQTTDWQTSYDGRKKEPIDLPMKFPLLLAQGADGIAVGLSTKILPHNFNELIDASIKALQGKSFHLYPDFQTGGMIDVSDYNGGKRGGKVKVRARIEVVDKKTLAIRELPYAVTTNSLIDNILKANDKGKIKIKKVVDNTAQEVEVLVELAPGTSPDVTMDALYAFTYCEVSISPNACVIIDNKPRFMRVEEMLQISADNTRELLRMELQIKLGELQEKWHFASLEKIFIEERIYREIEECESWEEVVEAIDRELKKYVVGPAEKPAKGDKRLRLKRSVTREDITKLTEIRIKRISKYNTFKAEEQIRGLEEELKQVQYDLDNITDYAIEYYKRLKEKYGKDKKRKTRIMTFDQIEATQVVANNTKLYVNRKEGFIGAGLKKDEFVCDCSDIDDIIVFRRDGKFQVTRIADKTFVGKDIIHVDVWKKGDERTTYNMAYLDAGSGHSRVKRFHVKAITRDKEYDLTKGAPRSKVLYFSANPNGESEVIHVQLSQSCRAKIKQFDFDFGELAIKGRSSQGNILTKYPVRKLSLKEVGQSTLGALKVWMDEASGKLNTDERGRYLGEFDTGDQILALYKDGSYEVAEFDQTKRFDPLELLQIEKFHPETVISAIHYDGNKKRTLVKRFQIETTSTDQRFPYISDARSSALLFATTDKHPVVEYSYRTKSGKETEQVDLVEFIDVKGWKALGNRLNEGKATGVKQLENKEEEKKESTPKAEEPKEKYSAGDTIEFDSDGQGELF
jgi:topoisomerase-4 subunit A